MCRNEASLDVLTFISEVVSALAWPLAVAFVVIFLRKPLAELIRELGRRVQRVRFPGGEAQFGEELDALVEVVDEAGLPRAPDLPFPASRWLPLAEASPHAAVMDAWRNVERALRDAARRLEIPEGEVRPPVALIGALGRREVLGTDDVAIISDLRRLRNVVAHEREPGLSFDDAMRYAFLADRVIAKLLGVSGTR